MPSLRALLEEHQIASALFEREVMSSAPWRAAVAAAIAASIAAVGWVLFATGIPSGGIHVNALIGLLVGLGGLGLLVTTAVALRS